MRLISAIALLGLLLAGPVLAPSALAAPDRPAVAVSEITHADGAVTRAREAADESLETDRAAISGLEAQAQRLLQAAQNVMAAPGARFTASYRLGAARALEDAATRIDDKVERLREADQSLLEALETRYLARAEIARSILALTEMANTGVLAELDRTPEPSEELLAAKAAAFESLAEADRLADLLAPADDLVVTLRLPPETAEETLDAWSGLVARAAALNGASPIVSRRADSGEIILIAPWPVGMTTADVEQGLAATLFDLAAQSNVPASPALLDVERSLASRDMTGFAAVAATQPDRAEAGDDVIPDYADGTGEE